MFLKDVITMDLTQVQETVVDVGMSTGSISTFCTTATPQAKARARPSNKHDSTKPLQETSADQASVLTGTSMLEVDFNVLMQCITVALQIKPSSLKSPPSGSESGKPS